MRGLNFLTRSAAAILLVTLGMSPASADEGIFTLKSIKGSWGFSGDGVLASPDLEGRLPIAGIGVVTFDGEGGCKIVGTNNLNGMALPIASDFCSYEVNPDGTGSSDASFPAMGRILRHCRRRSGIAFDPNSRGGLELCRQAHRT